MNDLISIKKQILLNTYRKEIWDFYNFSIIELFIFDRFFNWASTGQMIFIMHDGKKFFLIDYFYIAPSWGMSEIYLKKIMLGLSGSMPKNVSTNLKYPLIRLTQKDEYKKWKSYYGFEIGTMNTLISWDSLSLKRKAFLEEFINMDGLFTELPIQPKQIIKDKDFHKVPAHSVCLDLYKSLLQINTNNGKRLFVNHIIPADAHHYNATYAHFQDAMFCLYEGKFLTTYNSDKMVEWFRIKYKYYLNNESIKEKIRSCKHDWNKIKEIVLEAGNNYALWFDVNSEQYDKDALPRSIVDWIYSAHTETSMFYVSLLQPPTSAREAEAERLFNRINPKYRKIFYSLKQESFDGYTFWNKINDLIKWYDKYWGRLTRQDINCAYWLDGITANFLNNYKEWLMAFTDEKPFLKNIGINNNTFDLYIKQKIKDHGIEIEIPRSL